MNTETLRQSHCREHNVYRHFRKKHYMFTSTFSKENST